MSDTDSLTLQEARQAIWTIDSRYRGLSTIDDKELLKSARNEAFSAYSAARLVLLQEGVITTLEDLEAMRTLRAEIDQAAATQTLLVAALRTARWLAGLATRA